MSITMVSNDKYNLIWLGKQSIFGSNPNSPISVNLKKKQGKIRRGHDCSQVCWRRRFIIDMWESIQSKRHRYLGKSRVDMRLSHVRRREQEGREERGG